jgi:hypothetical protein
MKVCTTLLSLVLAGTVFAAIPACANQDAAEKKKATATKKETKWQGNVVRIYKDQSQMDIRDAKSASTANLKKVAYDDKTEWTKLGKPGKQEDVKEESFVIVLGDVDDQGVLHAKRIDLRLPR